MTISSLNTNKLAVIPRKKLEQLKKNTQPNSLNGLAFTAGIPPNSQSLCNPREADYCLEGFSQNKINGELQPFNANLDDRSTFELIQTGHANFTQVSQWHEFAAKYNLLGDFTSNMPAVLENQQAPAGAQPCSSIRAPLVSFGGNYALALTISRSFQDVCNKGQKYLNDTAHNFDFPFSPSNIPDHKSDDTVGRDLGIGLGVPIALILTFGGIWYCRSKKMLCFSVESQRQRRLAGFNKAIASFNKKNKLEAADPYKISLVTDTKPLKKCLTQAQQEIDELKNLSTDSSLNEDDKNHIKKDIKRCEASLKEAQNSFTKNYGAVEKEKSEVDSQSNKAPEQGDQAMVPLNGEQGNNDQKDQQE